MNPERGGMAPGLYMVAVPIGNARDITLRALDILRDADVLAAEDTRSLRRLLEIHGVPLGDRPCLAYHDHNGERVRPRLLDALAAGQSVAYASEAGTPMISDPGFDLVRAAREAGYPVTTAPGASAVIAALTVAGLPTDRFCFGGFLPNAGGARRRAPPAPSRPPAMLSAPPPRSLSSSAPKWTLLWQVRGRARPSPGEAEDQAARGVRQLLDAVLRSPVGGPLAGQHSPLRQRLARGARLAHGGCSPLCSVGWASARPSRGRKVPRVACEKLQGLGVVDAAELRERARSSDGRPFSPATQSGRHRGQQSRQKSFQASRCSVHTRVGVAGHEAPQVLLVPVSQGQQVARGHQLPNGATAGEPAHAVVHAGQPSGLASA